MKRENKIKSTINDLDSGLVYDICLNSDILFYFYFSF